MNENLVFAWPQCANYLEELVQCPVCRDRPVTGPVPMCVRGHHVCQRCRIRISICPSCRSDFSQARNFVVENLCLKLSNASVKSCRIGSCQTTLPADPMAKHMYSHVRNCHLENLIKVKTRRHFCGSSCSKIWQLEYNLKRFYDFALYAQDLGLFFVNLYIDEGGNLLVSVQMANSRQVNKFHYEVSLYVPQKKLPEECEGMVQECSNTTIKYSQALKYDKRLFSCYFEPDFVTLNDCAKPFTLTMFIYHY